MGKGLAAFPRVANGDGRPEIERINRGLAAIDQRLVPAATECRQAQERGSMTRAVEVTLSGTRYLSLVAFDDWFCGAYPDDAPLALVYDLQTGRPVNWQKLLPPSFAVKAATATSFDGTVIGIVSSRALGNLYARAAATFQKAEKLDCDTPDEAGNYGFYQDVGFQIWPDAKQGGMAMEAMTLPHVIKVCGARVVVPSAVLRRLGADPTMMDEIDKAHARIGQPAR